MNITTSENITRKGVTITAKGGGKQRTIAPNPVASVHSNHGAAAGELAKAHGLNFNGVTIAVDAESRTGRFVL